MHAHEPSSGTGRPSLVSLLPESLVIGMPAGKRRLPRNPALQPLVDPGPIREEGGVIIPPYQKGLNRYTIRQWGNLAFNANAHRFEGSYGRPVAQTLARQIAEAIPEMKRQDAPAGADYLAWVLTNPASLKVHPSAAVDRLAGHMYVRMRHVMDQDYKGFTQEYFRLALTQTWTPGVESLRAVNHAITDPALYRPGNGQLVVDRLGDIEFGVPHVRGILERSHGLEFQMSKLYREPTVSDLCARRATVAGLAHLQAERQRKAAAYDTVFSRERHGTARRIIQAVAAHFRKGGSGAPSSLVRHLRTTADLAGDALALGRERGTTGQFGITGPRCGNWFGADLDDCLHQVMGDALRSPDADWTTAKAPIGDIERLARRFSESGR